MKQKECKHNIQFTKCKRCFEEIFGKPDKQGRRRGFNVIGDKTGGKW